MEIGDCRLKFAVPVGKWIKVLHRIHHPGKRLVAMDRRKAEVQVLQEMGFTGTIVAIDPDTRMAYLSCADCIQDVVKSVQNLVSKDVFLDFNLDC